MPKETNNELLEFLSHTWQELLLYLDENELLQDTHLDEAELAILLSTRKENYERFLELELFNALLKKLDLRADIYHLELIQVRIFNALKFGFFDKNELIKALQVLYPLHRNDKLLQILTSLQIKAKDDKKEFFSQSRNLEKIALELLNLSEDELLNETLRLNLQRFKANEFNIIIAGIMNAGKSSLLNALLKTRILGVSNIPETANLSLLKYAKEPKAKIYFWDKASFENVQKNALYDEKLALVLDDLKTEVQSYIKEEGLSKELNIDEIQTYSSAKNKLSSLIAKIELFAPLEFLEDGVCIIDTPGLDDVLIQRELITKEYMANCDFLVYLMSASQSLSQKDSDFLLSLLLNSRISRFLIIISKADLLEEKELDEVIAYTQKSLKTRLKEAGADEELILKLDFLSISSKLALDFYEGKADEKALEQSKIPLLQNYLNKQVFNSTRSKVILEGFKKELLLCIVLLINKLNTQNKLLQGENLHNEKALQELLKQSEAYTQKIEALQSEFEDFKQDLKVNKNKAEALFARLFKILEDKIADEKAHKSENIMQLFWRLLEDGFADILRQIRLYNYEYFMSFKEQLELKFAFFSKAFDNDFEALRKLINKAFEDFINTQAFKSLQTNLQNLAKSKDEILSFKNHLHNIFEEFLQGFDFQTFLAQIELEKEFNDFLKIEFENYETEQKRQNETLQKSLKNLQANDALAILQDNEKLISKLESLKKDLEHAN